MTDLLSRECRRLTGELPPGDWAIHDHLARRKGWRLAPIAIENDGLFRECHETIAIVNGLAWVRHLGERHPELAVGCGRGVERSNTPLIRGTSPNDFIRSAKTDALVALVG